MSAVAWALVVSTVLISAALVVHHWRHPGPDARGVTLPPVSERPDARDRPTPPYPGEGRPAGPDAETQDPGRVGGGHS